MFAVLSVVFTPSMAGARPTEHPSASHEASTACRAGHSRLLTADAQAQVYVTRSRPGYVAVDACVYGQHRSLQLAECGPEAENCGATLNVALAGPVLAFGRSRTIDKNVPGQPIVAEWYVIVQNLRTGKLLHKVPTGMARKGAPGDKIVGIGFTTTIVVKSDGAVAWIAGNEQNYEVHALDKTGARLLASGNIDPKSLALAGSTLYWTEAGKPASATLN